MYTTLIEMVVDRVDPYKTDLSLTVFHYAKFCISFQVTISDFRYMMENLRIHVEDKEIEEIIKEADKNHRGLIAYNGKYLHEVLTLLRLNERKPVVYTLINSLFTLVITHRHMA